MHSLFDVWTQQKDTKICKKWEAGTEAGLDSLVGECFKFVYFSIPYDQIPYLDKLEKRIL